VAIEPEFVRRELEGLPTEELVEILRRHDEEEWQPEVFGIVEAVLRSRGVDPAQAAAAATDEAEEEEAGGLVSLESFTDPLEAQMCKMALESGGIPAWTSDERGGVVPGFENEVLVTLEVLVRHSDEPAARELLESLGAEAAETGQSREACPSCGIPREPGAASCPACGELLG
jgi:Putative prokaryotic signal transducing protein